jgi:hypothetical protein
LATTLAQQCRTLMRSPWYLETFAQPRLLAGKSAVDEFMTTRMGARLATSVGGTLTGKGGDYIIIDDPIKAEDAYSDVARKRVKEWYGNTLYSRLNSKQHGAIIVIMQRLHEDDLVGHDVWRKKVDYPELKRAAIAIAQRFQPGKILVEEKSSGIQLFIASSRWVSGGLVAGRVAAGKPACRLEGKVAADRPGGRYPAEVVVADRQVPTGKVRERGMSPPDWRTEYCPLD